LQTPARGILPGVCAFLRSPMTHDFWRIFAWYLVLLLTFIIIGLLLF
jgi:hypothetical protein